MSLLIKELPYQCEIHSLAYKQYSVAKLVNLLTHIYTAGVIVFLHYTHLLKVTTNQ